MIRGEPSRVPFAVASPVAACRTRFAARSWLAVPSRFARAVAVAVAIAGCREPHLLKHNAPGNADLATPLPHENGKPDRIELASDPGHSTLVAIGAPYFLWGHGRVDASGASREVGMELRFEKWSFDRDAPADIASSAAITVGYGFAQYGDGRHTDAPGALYVEANYRTVLGGTFPVDVGLGPAYDFDAVSSTSSGGRSSGRIGGQLSLRIPLVMLRTRYVDGDGYQVMAGFEVPMFPFVFEWSH